MTVVKSNIRAWTFPELSLSYFELSLNYPLCGRSRALIPRVNILFLEGSVVCLTLCLATVMTLVSRPGRSQGLLYKHFCGSFVNEFINGVIL